MIFREKRVNKEGDGMSMFKPKWMNGKQIRDHKAMIRCGGCFHYSTDANGVYICTKYSKPFNVVSDDKCPYDGSKRA